MNNTPFPARPVDVVPLTFGEFLFELDLNDAPSLDVVCRRFADDENRAVVWLLRFRALRAWCARPEMTEWMQANSAIPRDLCEVAAGFELNEAWDFDAERFCAAVDAVVGRRR